MKNSLRLALVVSLTAFLLSSRQASALIPVPVWDVGVKSSSTNPSPTRDVAVDSAGNTYVVGGFYGTVDFDPSANTVNLAPDETLGAFIAKYTPSGALDWAFDLGYGNSSQFNSVKVDSAGDIWVGGGLAGKMNPLITQVNVNPRGTATYLTGLSENGSHAVMLKYNSSGILLDVWKPMAASAGGYSRIFDFDFGASTGLIVAGSFSGTHDFDTDPAVTENSTPVGLIDAFVGAYSATGAYFDHVTAGGASYDLFASVDYRNGNVVAGGAVDDEGSVSSYAWGSGSFVHNWTFAIGSNNSYDRVYSVAIDPSDNVLVAGTIAGTKDFKGKSATAVNRTASNTYTNAAYLAQYSSTGMHLLSHVYSSGTGSASAYADQVRMVIGGDDSVYVASRVMGTVDFDVTGTTANYSTPSNAQSVYLAKYDSSLVLDGVSMIASHSSSNSTGQIVVGIATTSNNQGLRLAFDFGFSSTTTAKKLIESFGPDTVAPQVSNVTSTNSNGSYKDGTQLTIKVTFNESVAVTGTPQILLNLISGGRTATYTSGTGTTELLFTYTTQSGDSTADLEYTSTTALTLNGGTIADAWGNSAVVTLPATGSGSSISGQKAIVVDTDAPSLASIAPTNGSTGVAISSNIVLTFSETMVRGTGSYTLLSGNSCATTVETISATAAGVAASGSTITINPVANLNYSTNYCLTYPAGFVKDVAGNSAAAMTLGSSPRIEFETVGSDTTAPTATLTSPGATSSSRTLTYNLTFSEPISGLSSGDFSLGGTATCSVAPSASSGTSLSVVVTCSTDGTVILELTRNTVTDTALNTGPITDATASTVTISTPVATTTTSPTSPPSVTPTSSPVTSASTSTVPEATNSNSTPSSSTTPLVTSSTVAGSGTNRSTATTISSSTNAGVVAAGEDKPMGTTSTSSTTIPLNDVELPEMDDEGAGVLLDGRRIAAKVTRENNEFVLTAGPISARIWVIQSDGKKVSLSEDGRLKSKAGDSVTVAVEGFASNSDVEVRLYSDPLLLGRSQVDDRGQLSASYSIPEGVENGDHRIVLLGETENEPVTFALAIQIGDDEGGVNFSALILTPLVIAIIAALLIPVAIRRRRRAA